MLLRLYDYLIQLFEMVVTSYLPGTLYVTRWAVQRDIELKLVRTETFWKNIDLIA